MVFALFLGEDLRNFFRFTSRRYETSDAAEWPIRPEVTPFLIAIFLAFSAAHLAPGNHGPVDNHEEISHFFGSFRTFWP